MGQALRVQSATEISKKRRRYANETVISVVPACCSIFAAAVSMAIDRCALTLLLGRVHNQQAASG